MDTRSKASEILSRSGPVLGSFNRKERWWVISLSVLILGGIYGLIRQIVDGHIITGMRDHVVWGVFIVNFIFLIGFGYAGSVISAFLYLSRIRFTSHARIKWAAPVIRVSLIMTVAATIVGPLFILLCVGRLDRLHHLFIYARLQSPITWDVIAIITYIVGSILFLYLTVIRDFAVYRELVPGKRLKNLYRRLSLGFRNLPAQGKKIDFSTNVIAVLIIPIAIIVSSILSWIFGMTLRPGWHSTIFGPYFVLAAIYSGTGMLIILLWIYRKFYDLGEFITIKHFTYLGYVLIALGAGYGYFTFSEYFTDWYTSKAWNADLITKLFSWSEYGPWTLFANVFGIVIPLVVIGIPRLRTINNIAFVSVLMVVAMWVKRYLIVVPTLETTLIPMQELRPEYVNYTATWIEWIMVIAGFALFALLITLATKFISVIPVWSTTKADSK